MVKKLSLTAQTNIEISMHNATAWPTSEVIKCGLKLYATAVVATLQRCLDYCNVLLEMRA